MGYKEAASCCGNEKHSIPLTCMKLTFAVCLVLCIILYSNMSIQGKLAVVQTPSYHSDKYMITLEENTQNNVGDMMFNYASLYGIAHQNKLHVTLPANFSLFQTFRNISSITLSNVEHMGINWRNFNSHNKVQYDSNMFQLPVKHDVRLCGYYKSWKYFHSVEHELRKEIQFDSPVLSTAEKLHKSILTKYGKVVLRIAIQITRSVFKSEDIIFGETTPGKDYYIEAIEYFTSRYLNIVFIIVGDDIQWWKANVSPISQYRFVYVTGFTQVEDLAVLSMCNHSIISVGALGWWGAWLANGTTIYYSKWPKPYSQLDEKVTKQDYFYSHWIPLPAVNTTQEGENTCTESKQNTVSIPIHNDASQQELYISSSCSVNDGRGLGNLMFNYAALLGIATTNNMTAIFPCEMPPLYQYFNLKIPQYYDFKTKIGNYETFTEYQDKANTYDSRTEKLKKTKQNIMLQGYYQSWKYFNNIEETIRQHFTFKSDVLSLAESYMGGLREKYGNNSVFIGMHVRRGDKLGLTNFGDIVPKLGFYKSAMSYFSSHFPHDIVFVVCSDDNTWSRQKITFAEHIEYAADHSAIVDLAILSLCDHTIVSVGTFGWWAAWLVNGITVYYDGWPRPGSLLAKMVTKSDYFYKKWIPIKDNVLYKYWITMLK